MTQVLTSTKQPAETHHRRKSRALDVTTGVIWQQLLRLCLPVFLSSFFQQLQLICNAWVVGQYAGTEDFAALQATSSLCDIAISFSLGLGIGCSVIVSQYYGAKRTHEVSRAVHTAMGIALVAGIFFAVVGYVCSPIMLTMMRTPQQLMQKSLDFTYLFMIGMVFSLIYNIGSGLQRAVGDTTTPSFVVATTGIVNAILDIVFVAGIHLETRGCGYATLISLIWGAVVTLICLMRAHGCWKLRLREIRIEYHYAKKMLLCGFPLAIQGSMFGISNVVIQGSINIFGEAAIAAWGLSNRMVTFVWMGSDALGSSITTFSAQNFGARNIARMKKGTMTSLIMSALLVGGGCAIVLQVAEPFAHFFTHDEEVIAITLTILMCNAPFMFFYAIMDVFSGAIRGSGESLGPMIITIIGTCVLRLIWVGVLEPFHPQLLLILSSYPISWSTTAAIFALYYLKGNWLRRGAAKRTQKQAA